MSDDKKGRLWAHISLRPTEIAPKDGERGLDIIASVLAVDEPWKPMVSYELFLISREKNSDFTAGANPKVLRINCPELQLPEKLDAGLQLAGVVDRSQAISNGLVLNIAPGKCSVVANEEGQHQLESYIKQRPERTVAARQ